MSPATCRTPRRPLPLRRRRAAACPVAARHCGWPPCRWPRSPRDPGAGLAAGRRTAGTRPVSRRRLGALHRPGAEGAAARNSPAIRRRRACTRCAARSPHIWRRPAAWSADPGCIVITAGTQQALRAAADLLLDPGDAAWVEDPGYIAGRGALLAAGADAGAGAQRHRRDGCRGRESAWRPHARLALVAPSHATPLGGPMPIGRRLALLDWAARANAWVLEDDCDVGIPLGRQAAAATGQPGSLRAGDLLRHVQQDTGPGAAHWASPWCRRRWCPPSCACAR